MKEIKISKPTPADVVGIQEVFYKTWLATYPNKEAGVTEADIEERFKNRLTPERLEERRQMISNLPASDLYLVAKDGDRVVGLCRFNKKEDCNQLQAIYVLPEYQGRGIGRMFWDECLKFADPKKKTIVHIATYNAGAIAFYTKLGFVDTGKRFSEERHRMPISRALIPEMEMELR